MPSVDTIIAVVDITIVLVVLVTGFLLHRQARRFRRLRTEPGMVVGFLGLALLALWSVASLAVYVAGPAVFGVFADPVTSHWVRTDLRWPSTALAIAMMATGAVMVARVIADLDIERRRSEAQLQRAVRLAKVGHWIWDHRIDKCIYASPEIAEIFGVSVEEYLENASSFESELNWYPETDRDAYFNTVHAATEAGTGYELVTAIRRRNGEIRHIHELAEVETDEEGRPTLTFGTSRDITDAKNLEESLISANKAKSDFLAHMSHELRTPLNSILGFSQIMKEELMGELANPKYQEYVAHISRSGHHLHAVLTDILDLSKIEAGRMEVQEGPVDLNDLVASCAAMSEGAALSKNVSLDISLPEETVAVTADAKLVRQAVFNILSNAIHYSPAAGHIDIALRHGKQEGADIVIADEGPGIPASDLELVLKPFSQSNRNPELAQSGTGLGLSLSSRIMELHDGKLSLESQLGEGTRVSLHLPETRILQMGG